MFSQTLTGTGLLRSLARQVGNRRKARQSMFTLAQLDERALKDIGLWRLELPHATGHPLLWRWPR